MSRDILEISFVSIGRVSHFEPRVSAALVRYRLFGLLPVRRAELLKFWSILCPIITSLVRTIYLQPSELSSPAWPPVDQAAASKETGPF